MLELYVLWRQLKEHDMENKMVSIQKGNLQLENWLTELWKHEEGLMQVPVPAAAPPTATQD